MRRNFGECAQICVRRTALWEHHTPALQEQPNAVAFKRYAKTFLFTSKQAYNL